MDAKFSTKTKTVPVQNLFRYISFFFAETWICKIKKIYGVERYSEKLLEVPQINWNDHKIKGRCQNVY